MRWERMDRNPAVSARPPTPRRRTILATSPEDVAKVIAEARARSAALGLYLWLVVVTGVRRGELRGLQIRDVDLGLPCGARLTIALERSLAGPESQVAAFPLLLFHTPRVVYRKDR